MHVTIAKDWQKKKICYIKTVATIVRSSQHQTQIIVLHCKRFLNASLTAVNLPCKPLFGEWWKPARTDNQCGVDWELNQIFMGVCRSGVGSIGTGSSHRRLLSWVQSDSSLLFCSNHDLIEGRKQSGSCFPALCVIIYPSEKVLN